MIGGIPYKNVHVLDFEPGEVRLNVNYQSANALFRERMRPENKEAYQTALAQGKQQLQVLRSSDSWESVKDQRLEAEQMAIELEAVKCGLWFPTDGM